MRRTLAYLAALTALIPAAGSAQFSGSPNGAAAGFMFDVLLRHTASQSVLFDPEPLFETYGYGNGTTTVNPARTWTQGDSISGFSTDGSADVQGPDESYAEAATLTFLRVLNSSTSPFLLPIQWYAYIDGGIYGFGFWEVSLWTDGPDLYFLKVDGVGGAEAPAGNEDDTGFFEEVRGTRFVTLPGASIANGVLTPSVTELSFTADARAFIEASTPIVTPEPGSILLLGTGLLGVAAVMRRRRRRA
jgi:hypothetical protein